MSKEVEFFYGELVVGCFEKNDCPMSKGEYGYLPYRGSGHYELIESLKRVEDTICYYMIEKEKTSFKVDSSGKYRVLKLSHFERDFNQK